MGIRWNQKGTCPHREKNNNGKIKRNQKAKSPTRALRLKITRIKENYCYGSPVGDHLPDAKAQNQATLQIPLRSDLRLAVQILCKQDMVSSQRKGSGKVNWQSRLATEEATP